MNTRRQKLLEGLQERLRAGSVMTEEDEAFVRWCAAQWPVRQLKADKVLDALEVHRACLEAIEEGFAQEALCGCSGCEEAMAHLQQRRQELLAQWRERLEDLIVLQDAVQSMLSDLAADADQATLQRHFHSAIQEVAPLAIDRGLDDHSAKELLLSHLAKKLRRYKKRLKEKKEERRGREQLEAYFYGDFQQRWDARCEEFGDAWDEAGVDGGALARVYWQKARDVVKRFEGNNLKKGKNRLSSIFREFQDEARLQLREQAQRLRLEELYDERSDFALCFPEARKLKREFWFFCGPTNSGKTHAALNALAEGESGVYLAPLRLLALEGQQELMERGVLASYVTGEERELVEGATFVASTIEMLAYSRHVEVAVIDEIQMIEDAQRGWAWTNALIGVPAQRVILTGSANALPVVQQLVDYLGETLMVREFSRFNRLEVCDEIDNLDDLEPGTAIVCFSRRDVLGLKGQIERRTPYQVSVIYGGLSPDVRRQEAKRFRERKADILVATDAISMGLNLPIRKVLFWETEKFYQGQSFPLRDTEIKQIAGRAGRYGLESCGYVGAFSPKDLRRLNQALARELEPLQGPCMVQPLLFHIEMIADVLHTRDLEEILRYFRTQIWFSKEHFEPLVTDEMLELARYLQDAMFYGSLKEKFIFVSAPVDLKANSVVDAHISFAERYMEGREVTLDPALIDGMLRGTASSLQELRVAEDRVKIVTLYRWLSFRFPESFLQTQAAQAYKEILNDYISRSLARGELRGRCRRCGARLPLQSRHPICDACFRKKRWR